MKSRCIVVLALAAVAAEAQQKIEVKTTSAVADGRVVIDSQAGTIHVVGWARDEVEVGGTLGRGAEAVNLNSHGARTDVEVETMGNPHGVRSDLEIKVPAASQVEIDSFSADVKVEGVTGRVRIETVNGGLAVSGPAQEIDAQSVNGRVDIAGACPRIHAESVNGAVTIKGARGEIEASTVNGRLVVSGDAFQKGSLSGVSGSVQFEGALAERGWLEVETVSGGVELRLPATVSAEFNVSSFSGGIENELGPPARKTGHYTPEQELRFTTGSGGARVSVKTLSGSINLLKQR